MKPQLPADYHDDGGHIVGPYPKAPEGSLYMWLGQEAEQYDEQIEDDGWITLWPRVA